MGLDQRKIFYSEPPFSRGTLTGVEAVAAGLQLELFSDDFNRTNSTVIGNNWAESIGDWVISGNKLVGPGNAAYNHCVNGSLNCTDYIIEAETRQPGGTRYSALVARWNDTNNYYFLLHRQGSSSTHIWRVRGGTFTELAILTGHAFAAGANLKMKMEVTGTTIRGKVWLATDAEPGPWTVSTTDANHSAGKFGCLEFGTAAEFDNFTATGAYLPTGNRIAPSIELPFGSGNPGLSISWSATTPTGASVTIETAVNDSATVAPVAWDTQTGGLITGIPTGSLIGKYLWVKQTLETTELTETPILTGLYIYVPINRLILFDQDPLNSQLAQLNYEAMVDPLIIQDSETGQDTLQFAYPIEHDLRHSHTWGIYADKVWGDIAT